MGDAGPARSAEGRTPHRRVLLLVAGRVPTPMHGTLWASAGAVVAGFFLPRKIRDGAECVQILRFKQPQRVGLGNAFARDDLFVNVAQLAALNEKIHEKQINSKSKLVKVKFNRKNQTIQIWKKIIN